MKGTFIRVPRHLIPKLKANKIHVRESYADVIQRLMRPKGLPSGRRVLRGTR